MYTSPTWWSTMTSVPACMYTWMAAYGSEGTSSRPAIATTISGANDTGGSGDMIPTTSGNIMKMKERTAEGATDPTEAAVKST